MARNGSIAQQQAPPSAVPGPAPPPTPVGVFRRVPPQPLRDHAPDDADYLDPEEIPLAHRPRQQKTLHKVQHSVQQHFDDQGRDAVVCSDVTVTYPQTPTAKRVIPDLFVVLDHPEELSIEDGTFELEDDQRLDFVLEVLSPSTADYDRDGKKELYRKMGVREYFMFQPDKSRANPDPTDAVHRMQGFQLKGKTYREISPVCGG